MCATGDEWSLSHAGAGGDSVYSAHGQSSSVTSVGGQYGWTPADHNTYSLDCDDMVIHDDDTHLSPRLQRLNSAARRCDEDGDDNCYRTLADIVTAGAYQINGPTALSC